MEADMGARVSLHPFLLSVRQTVRLRNQSRIIGENTLHT